MAHCFGEFGGNVNCPINFSKNVLKIDVGWQTVEKKKELNYITQINDFYRKLS